MTGLFTRALKMAMVSGWIVLPVCLLRHVLHRCPKKYTVCLWALVAVRLVCPVTVRSSLSLIPQRLELAASKLATLPLGAIWLAGMGTMLQLGFFRLLRLTRRLKEAVLWKDNVWVCDYLPTPFVLGVFRPKIYLPSCLKPEDAQLVLAHEREHIRRLDIPCGRFWPMGCCAFIGSIRCCGWPIGCSAWMWSWHVTRPPLPN